METLVAKPSHSLPKRRRRLALAHGARSAFDMTGLSTLHDEVFRPRSLKSVDPAEMIAIDMTRVMDRFGRSAACARRALEAGIEIQDLEPGCTANGASAESPEVAPRHTRRSRGTALKSID
jgi:hypothetical protein